MPLEKAALPLPERDLVVALMQAVVRALGRGGELTSWDDLKTLLLNGAALAIAEDASSRGESLAEVAERLRVDVTTLRRNLPPPPRAETVAADLAREIYQAVDREGRATMAEIEALVSDSPPAQRARRSRDGITVADVVVTLVEDDFLARVERSKLPTQYQVSRDNPVLEQKGQTRDDWMRGLAFAVSLSFDTALKQAREINSAEFAQRMRSARQSGEPAPVPARERTPWFFVNRPAELSEHDVNERFAAAIRGVIADLERDRPVGDKGQLMHLALALNHSWPQTEPEKKQR